MLTSLTRNTGASGPGDRGGVWAVEGADRDCEGEAGRVAGSSTRLLLLLLLLPVFCRGAFFFFRIYLFGES